MIKVLFDPEAREEFLESAKFYENRQQGLGKRFNKELEHATQQIVESPFQYRTLKPHLEAIFYTSFLFRLYVQ